MEKKALRVTVFDLVTEDCARTAGAVQTYFEGRGLRAEIATFTKMQSFVLDYKQQAEDGKPYDMAFVGVDNMIGAEAARHIRMQDEALPLFLASTGSDFALEGFRLVALDYLTKPVCPEQVARAVGRIGLKNRGFRVAAALQRDCR